MVIPKEKLKSLYESGLSMQEIADKEKWSYPSVRYWMQQSDIRRRSWSDATYAKRNQEGDPFKINLEAIRKKKELFYTGIGLYLGEGDKRSKYNVKLANTDPYILRIFLRFLREICGVDESKIKAELNIFNDVSLKKAIKFWLDNIGIERDQLKTITIRESKGGSYKNKSTNGTLSIYMSNMKLKAIINNWSKGVVNA